VLFATNNDDPVKRPELAREAVRRLESKGHRAELHVLRGVPNTEVPVWLNAADAVLLTSHQEGSPTIVKEALACGRPIVSVRVGDVPARIGGVHGCHLVDADPDALAHGLEAVMAGPAAVDPRAAAEQSLEVAAERLLDLYEWVLARETREPRSAASRTAASARISASASPKTAAGQEAR
jgi:glycosyltransferase involved in cell wall biosynthesis